MIINFLFLVSLFNVPFIQVRGDDHLGLFDFIFSIFFLFFILKRFKIVFDPFSKFFFLVFFLQILSFSINYSDASLRGFLYSVKFFELAILAVYVSSYRYDINFKINYLILCFYSFVVIALYIGDNYVGRSTLLFVDNSSGPLGFLTMLFFAFYLFWDRFKIVSMFFLILLLMMSFSKSFILVIFVYLIYRLIKFFINFRLYKHEYFIICISACFAPAFIYLFFNKFKYLVSAMTSFSSQTNFIDRVNYHWFRDFDSFTNSFGLIFGHGPSNISISYDSLYFYLFYVFGILGLFLFFVFLFYVFNRSHVYFKFYCFILLVSGLFLETALVSYSALQPFLIGFLSFISYQERVKSV